MTAALYGGMRLTGGELAVTQRVGIFDFPSVLAVRPRHATVADREKAFEAAIGRLVTRQVIDGGEVHPDLVAMLQALHRPEREWAMRLVTPDGTGRATVVQRGPLGELTRRVGDDVFLRALGECTEIRSMVAALVSDLPRAIPAAIEPFAAPLHELSECLSGTSDSVTLGDRLHAMGAEPAVAMMLGAALASRQAFAEIVHYALADDEGRISRARAAVGVFYTKRGRIVGAPSASPSGELWTTLRGPVTRLSSMHSAAWTSCTTGVSPPQSSKTSREGFTRYIENRHHGKGSVSSNGITIVRQRRRRAGHLE